LVNTDEPDQVLLDAERRVLEIQTKLHRWVLNPAWLVESPVRCEAHAGFGRRHGETHR